MVTESDVGVPFATSVMISGEGVEAVAVLKLGPMLSFVWLLLVLVLFTAKW